MIKYHQSANMSTIFHVKVKTKIEFCIIGFSIPAIGGFMNKFNIIKAGKYETHEEKRHLEEDCSQNCKFGFNWWFWLPKIRITKYNWDFMWLCFIVIVWSDK